MAEKPNEPSEVWEHPFAEIVDEKLKPIKASLLETQRFLASLSIRVTHNESISHPVAYQKASSQFASELTSAYIKVDKSSQPLHIASKFHSKRWKDLKKLGIKTLEIR